MAHLAGHNGRRPPARPGRPLAGTEPCVARVSAALPEATYAQLCALAHERAVSVSSLVRTLLTAQIEAQAAGKGAP